jgi:type VI secretion system FHA domain protein
MLLALSVISTHGAAMGPTAYKIFDQRGGSIGRVEQNDWTLPDPDKVVSSRHALLKCSGGAFYIEDTSTNGTFVNAPDRAISKAQPTRLNDGDRIFIGDYEILVQLIDDGVGAPEPVAATRSPVPEPPAQPRAPAYAPPPASLAGATGVAAADPLELIGVARAPPPPDARVPAARESAARAPAPDSIATVSALLAPVEDALIPEAEREGGLDFAPLADEPEPAPVAADPAPQLERTAVRGASAGAGEELLVALGLDPARIDPGVYQQLGAILRIVVRGMIEILQSRAEVKNNFRMVLTNIRPVENNPLKFSLNEEDALHNLFVKQNPGYLGAVDSFRDGFQDIAFHQLAMLAGIRAAYDAMLSKLHPDQLQDIYERKLRRTAMFSVGNRSKYWEMYRAQFEDLDKDKESAFQTLFGEEFAKAYHEQLNRLAAAARARRR